MPTFKAGFAGYDAHKGDTENLKQFIEQYNACIKSLTYTLNHLDEENLSTSFLQSSNTQEGENG